MRRPKTKTKSTGFRFQGTDGIRREVKPASSEEFLGLTPQQVFLQRGFITEEFMELYAYAHVNRLAGKTQKGEVRAAFVVGWDPRDPQGLFTDAVARGVRRAGADVLCIGVVPTPLVPIYMLYKNVCGGFMVTASHNPKDQNGIKTFYAYRGMKPLPRNDVKLTQDILALNYRVVAKKPITGNFTDCRQEALEVFKRFSLNSENSWASSAAFESTALVVDPANGSLSGIAADVFRHAGCGEVIEVNNLGDVNLDSGVGDLEGHKIITSSMINKKSGAFRKHKAVLKMFELGRKRKQKILAGKSRISGAVFDADGDRFYRLDYHPRRDALLVLSGDETAFMQAQYLMARNPDRYQGAAYINTVESDLNAGLAAKSLGLGLHLAAVGDKWISLRIATLTAEARLKILENNKVRAALLIKRELNTLLRVGILDVHQLQKIEEAIDKLQEQNTIAPLAVGSEETGHNITLGWLDTEEGARFPVFFGNGLKSALNTFAATSYLTRNKSVQACYAYLEEPFKPGFKQTYYVYYVAKELFRANSAVWKQAKRRLFDEGKKQGYLCELTDFREDPDMLYVTLTPRPGAKTKPGAIFVRNSGTENKIGVNLRGDRQDAQKLKSIGERVVRFLFSTLKDRKNRLYKLELELLRKIETKKKHETGDDAEPRVLHEMKKQDLIRLTPNGFRLSPEGKWYISQNGQTK